MGAWVGGDGSDLPGLNAYSKIIVAKFYIFLFVKPEEIMEEKPK